MPNRDDDPTIGNDEPLWRRIIPRWIHRERGPGGRLRPGSVAFRDELSGELSLHRSSLITVAQILEKVGRDDISIAMITAGMARQLGYSVVSDPDEDDPSHVLIYPSPNDPDSGVLAKQAEWVACGIATKAKWL